MQKADLNILAKEDVFSLVGKEWMLVTAGNAESYNTMTASWGGFAILWGKPVAIIFVRPERYTHDFIEKNDHLTLSFYGNEYRKALQICGTKSGREIDKAKETGLTPITTEKGNVTFAESRLTVECRKIFKSEMETADFLDKKIYDAHYNPAQGGLHTIYVCEIEEVYTK